KLVVKRIYHTHDVPSSARTAPSHWCGGARNGASGNGTQSPISREPQIVGYQFAVARPSNGGAFTRESPSMLVNLHTVFSAADMIISAANNPLRRRKRLRPPWRNLIPSWRSSFRRRT